MLLLDIIIIVSNLESHRYILKKIVIKINTIYYKIYIINNYEIMPQINEMKFYSFLKKYLFQQNLFIS